MPDEKKLRVSAKQRLDLVKRAYYEFFTSDKAQADYVHFVNDVEEALNTKLDPKAK